MQDLYFIASKVVWFFLEPLHVLALLIALSTISRWLGSRLAGWLSVATFLWVVALGATPLSTYFVAIAGLVAAFFGAQAYSKGKGKPKD